MLINEVEHIVGLSKKAIRYYEELGLLHPKRKKENDYRIYGDEEIKKLKFLKFLRELDVPIRDLKLLEENKLSLKECIKERMLKIEEQEKNYAKVKKMCLEIITNENLENLDSYSISMNQLNKEGFTMRNLKTKKRKKIIGAVLSSFVFEIFFFFLIGILSYLKFWIILEMPFVIYLFLLFLFSIFILSIVWNCIQRVKEILGGEEDEASKY